MTKKLREGQSPCPCFLLFPCSSPKLKLRSAATTEAPLGEAPASPCHQRAGQWANSTPMPLPQRGQLPPSCKKQSCLPLPARGTFPAHCARSLSLRIGKNSPVIHERTPAAPPGNSSCSRQPWRAMACLLIPYKHPWAR